MLPTIWTRHQLRNALPSNKSLGLQLVDEQLATIETPLPPTAGNCSLQVQINILHKQGHVEELDEVLETRKFRQDSTMLTVENEE